MEPFVKHRGLVVPLDRSNVDTDAIIPKQYMKSVKRTGLGEYLFDDWRYIFNEGSGDSCSCRIVNPDFVLNEPRYRGASILLAKSNFGCGSSREHAPWAIREYGFRVIIAESFAEIFARNCLQNGILLVSLSKYEIEQLFDDVVAEEGFELLVNLEARELDVPGQGVVKFNIPDEDRDKLLNGLDDIDLALRHAEKIRLFEDTQKTMQPWLYE